MGSVTKADIDQLVAERTVAREFVDTVTQHGDRTALRWMQPDGNLGSITFTEMGDKAARAAAGLRSLGVVPGDRVVLMMRNIPEFHWLDMAVLLCGATPVSIYNSSSPDQVEYLVGHCAAVVAIVENADFLAKFGVFLRACCVVFFQPVYPRLDSRDKPAQPAADKCQQRGNGPGDRDNVH